LRLLRLKLAWLIDWAIPVRRGQVCFVSKRNAPISGNLRVMLDVMAAEPGLRVIVYKEGYTHAHTATVLRRQGVDLIDRFSLKALVTLLASELVVLSHSARDAYLTRRKRGRAVVNLWHGVAIKRIEAMMLPRGSLRAHRTRQRRIAQNSRIYDAVIASNPIDQLVNSLAFAVPHHQVHPIGLPRFDYLLEPWQQWPEDLLTQRQELEGQLKGRRLVLYAPTFREGGTSLANLITADDIALIRQHCRVSNSVLGIRPHPYWEGKQLELCDGESILDVGTEKLPEPAVALSLTSVLVADYSSIWVDYLLLNRPIFGLMQDLHSYIANERGLIYDIRDIFPGKITRNWDELITSLPTECHEGNGHYTTNKPFSLLPYNRKGSLAMKACKNLFKSLMSEGPND